MHGFSLVAPEAHHFFLFPCMLDSFLIVSSEPQRVTSIDTAEDVIEACLR